ncbi:MAG: hypothetical protein HOE11_00695 [Candidatus Diapherotrites archaeon]|nr:hypothetical protein [Candidatus Diapherotrites archaeon]MBT4596406.1 hypothetical protein [Candidatus Diapherotrites archaeon]
MKGRFHGGNRGRVNAGMHSRGKMAITAERHQAVQNVLTKRFRTRVKNELRRHLIEASAEKVKVGVHAPRYGGVDFEVVVEIGNRRIRLNVGANTRATLSEHEKVDGVSRKLVDLADQVLRDAVAGGHF